MPEMGRMNHLHSPNKFNPIQVLTPHLSYLGNVLLHSVPATELAQLSRGTLSHSLQGHRSDGTWVVGPC